jgi:hypothetical protein
MDAEHKRPLAAFVIVSATSALLLGQSLSSRPESPDTTRQTASHATHQPSGPSSSSADPANGLAVHGVTASPTYTPVKSIGRAPMLMARGDDGLGVSVGAVRDPHQTGAPKPAGPASESQETAPTEPTESPEPTPSGDPDEEEQGDGVPGPRSTPPHGPWNTGDPPPLGPPSPAPGDHTPPATPEPSKSATGTR